jgi:tetratricopeptide (TPR) repeat protein
LAARDAVSGSETVAFTGTRVGLDPVEICIIALPSDGLGVRGLAGTCTNRGVLLFADGKFSAALNNFDKAIDLDESIAESHINRGASLVALQQ